MDLDCPTWTRMAVTCAINIGKDTMNPDDSLWPLAGDENDLSPSALHVFSPAIRTTITSEMVFKTCSESWNATSDNLIVVKDDSHETIGTFPMDFLQRGGGDTATIQYLLSACRLVLEIPPETVLRLSAGHGILDDNFTVSPGVYELNGTFPPRPGPSAKPKSRLGPEVEAPSTVSKFTKSTSFWWDLARRDECQCLISGEQHFGHPTACQIVPSSLGQEKLDEICGPNVMSPFSTQNGLLLTLGHRISFNHYFWGIYVFEDSYIVHVFGHYDQSIHGIQLNFARQIVNSCLIKGCSIGTTLSV